MNGTIAVLFDRLGPYHVARIGAAAEAFPTISIEFGAHTSTYAWDRVDTAGRFQRYTVVANGRVDDVSRGRFAASLFGLLEQQKPSVVAIPGWAHPGALLALRWALRTNTPVIVMSESQREDAVRVRWQEHVKRRVIALCSAGLVGGQRHLEYLRELGMPESAIFQGYDAVDNDYFARGAKVARENADAERARLNLPNRFLLASNRFIAKKNLFTLLRGYAEYRRVRGDQAAHLVLLGDGPLKPELVALRDQLGLNGHVLMPGFLQYDVLPTYYGLAEAFVHASTVEQWGLVVNEAMAAGLPVVVSRACGCAPDLVVEGENGYCFDPSAPDELTQALLKVTTGPDTSRRMGERSQAIIARWSPGVFAQQLGLARDAALRRGSQRSHSLDRMLLRALTRR